MPGSNLFFTLYEGKPRGNAESQQQILIFQILLYVGYTNQHNILKCCKQLTTNISTDFFISVVSDIVLGTYSTYICLYLLLFLLKHFRLEANPHPSMFGTGPEKGTFEHLAAKVRANALIFVK